LHKKKKKKSLLTYYVGAWLCFHLISLTGKVYCRRARDLGSSPAYTKNQLIFWPDGNYRNYIKKIKGLKKLNRSYIYIHIQVKKNGERFNYYLAFILESI
jgi:hypothetical protein